LEEISVKRVSTAIAVLALLLASAVFADAAAGKDVKKKDDTKKDKKEEKGGLNAGTFSGLELRGIGPALTSGRIVDLAVDARKPGTYFVASASGGVWKTTNGGATFKPVFDNYGSYSIGCVTIDPKSSLVVWVGTGENNSQRSVSYGDGVYKSVDGGKSWTNMGLQKSEHIAKILVDPNDSNVVWVAAQGPLWSPGGDRGLYKTTDGGKTWKASLTISENTGVTDVVMDPRDSNVLYAASYQRRRHVWTLIDGGPESTIYKTTDGGATWKKIESGLPKEDKGRIGLAISPAKPDTVYATVEAARGSSGFYRSTDAGAGWEKRSGWISGSPQYYQEIFADPNNADRVYAVDVFVKVTEDGGKTFKNLGEKNKHVDNHVVWIDPANTDHLLVGCDGGLYESFDRGATWMFKPNLPVTQFYRVAADNSKPFYYVYGGTQDNFSLGGPSRTLSNNGITNADWFITNGGDGFQTVVDPEDPNLVYAESQHAGIVRFDRRTGEAIDIQPQTASGEAPSRFNWDTPLMISPHSHTRIYIAAQRLYRSDDRGDSWRAISPDLTRQIDRNQLKVMGKVWGIDTVAKNASTSFYGNIVSLTESPRKENLLWLGTDDGLIQMTDDGGQNWHKIERFPGVPDNTYVSDIEASSHADGTVYAAFDNHKQGDFKPYLLESTDMGKTWTSIAGDLPARGTVYTVIEDPVKPDLLFVGTEFGIWFTIDGGKKWIQLNGNLPTIAVRDLTIQKRENDLVAATFGRGFYILDDITPLRMVTADMLQKDAVLFPVKPAWMYIEASQLGLPGKSFQGENFFTMANPPFGAVFTYYLKDDLKTRKKLRYEAEAAIEKEGGNLQYPKWEDVKAEELEKAPEIVVTVTDEEGNPVRRLTGPISSGFHRVAWDLRFPTSNPTELEAEENDNPFDNGPTGPLAAPGKYTVTIAKRVEGVMTPLAAPQTFEAVPLGNPSIPVTDRPATLAFQQKVARLQRAVTGALKSLEEARNRVNYDEQAIKITPAADPKLLDEAQAIENKLRTIDEQLSGDVILASHNEPTPPSIADRLFRIVGSSWSSTSAPTKTFQDDYKFASEAFAPVLEQLRRIITTDLPNLEQKLDQAGAPWTPGRLPSWKPE
jgi:photosystem II stability/assembly factor-like uncharacterized protein